MKQPILILSSLLCICGMQCAVASDSLEESVADTPIIEEELIVAEDNIDEELIIPQDNVSVDNSRYIQDTADELATMRLRVDELLIPRETTQNLWTDDAIVSNSASAQSVILAPMKKNKPQKAIPQGFSLGDQSYYGETVYIINNFLSGAGDNISETSENYNGIAIHSEYSSCPFNTVSECKIWARKPIISEAVTPRSKKLRDSVMCEISDAIAENPNISANERVMAPLMNRYRVLMRASQSCCTGGIKHRLSKAGASKKLIYQFLSDDANFSGFGLRCLVMNDEQIASTDKYQATNATVADVRNNCLCKSKETFKALLAPFEQLYSECPEFASSPFEYKHYDGLGRYVTDSVNMDVQNVLDQLEMCP